MPNPFMVNQAGMGSGMLDLGMGLLDRGLANRDRAAQEDRQMAREDQLMADQQAQQQAAQQQQQAILGQAAEMFELGDMDGLSRMMVENPQIQEAISGASDYKNDITKRNAVETSFKYLMGDGKPGPLMDARVKIVDENGGDPTESMEFMGLDDATRKKEAEMAKLEAKQKDLQVQDLT